MVILYTERHFCSLGFFCGGVLKYTERICPADLAFPMVLRCSNANQLCRTSVTHLMIDVISFLKKVT